MLYDPLHWYWRADDGRIFSSEIGTTVTQDDAAFSAWIDAGRQPTVWPRDDAGAQTNAVLYAVLAPYGLTITGYTHSSAQVSFLNFLGLFTSDEQVAIVNSTDPKVRLFCLMAAGATMVDLSDQKIIDGTKQLEALKLIGKGRAAQVLAGSDPSA